LYISNITSTGKYSVVVLEVNSRLNNKYKTQRKW